VCAAHPVRVEALDDLVWEHTCKLLEQPELVLHEYTRRTQKKQRQQQDVKELLAKKKREIKQRELAKERLLDLYQTGQVDLKEIEPRLKSLRAKITKLHEEWTLVEKDAKAEHQRLQLIEQFAMFTQRMTTNLATVGFAERKQIIRLLVEEVVVNTTTEELTVRHILPIDQPFPLCKRSNFTDVGEHGPRRVGTQVNGSHPETEVQGPGGLQPQDQPDPLCGRHAGTGVKQKGCKSLALNCPCGGLAGGRVYGVIHRLK
jgi:hypothetical protein